MLAQLLKKQRKVYRNILFFLLGEDKWRRIFITNIPTVNIFSIQGRCISVVEMFAFRDRGMFPAVKTFS